MKLTKADIDKVRHIEGFPIAKDEDIIALSRPPYYTACPNPFIEDFIRENGTPYDEATDDYHREPFAADVSEGKNDPIYNAHSYHTKVPYKAIMRYILHYTKPGDIVFDGFCGTGMTGVAAQMCGCPDAAFKVQVEGEMQEDDIEWGRRKAILNDLSPAASFIAQNYNTSIDDVEQFERDAKAVIDECEKECGWMYETYHVDGTGQVQHDIAGNPVVGHIEYTVWSDVFVCPSCSHEFVYWYVAVDADTEAVKDKFICPHCGAVIAKRDCDHAYSTVFDPVLKTSLVIAKQEPVRIHYSIGKKRYVKKPDANDFAIIQRSNELVNNHWYPTDRLPDGDKMTDPRKIGIEYIHQYFTNRNLYTLSVAYEKAKDGRVLFMITAIMKALTKMFRWAPHGKHTTGMPGTLFFPSVTHEYSIIGVLNRRIALMHDWAIAASKFGNDVIVTCGDVGSAPIPQNSVDYIFTDPPFGANLNYSELSFLWEAWLKIKTNTSTEAIMSKKQRKGLAEYQELMERAFSRYYYVLKPNRWMTVEFHNSQNAVWNSIQEALQRSGFVVADVRIINKKQGSYNQTNAAGAVQQDLVISTYKPKESFIRDFRMHAGDVEMVWAFVRQHLEKVPVVADGNRDGKLDIIAERQDYLLFDRMVAYHIMNGIPVPMDAHTFYDGLRQRFLQRDGMFFLPDQVNEYDEKRAHMELDTQQLSFVVTDEKNAIAWLNYVLRDGPKTYQEIQPMYLQELHQSKQEKMPELLDMLRENFVQDDKGAWYVPDLSNAADLAKVRRKALLKEFYDSCVPGKGKLKVFRMEAIRAGFDECWKTRDFKTIVAVGERLPESVLQEDPALLMYYDNACSRV